MDKDAIRNRVWDELEETGTARFPFPPHGRIPNFAGADEAADRLSHQTAWREAAVLKANPDAPQLPVRRAALRAGKTVYMAVPRLRDEQCFIELDPAAIDDLDEAATIGGSSAVGVKVGPDEMEPVDLIVVGSVAVDDRGGRIGKGEGYSDLEFAILTEAGVLAPDVLVATTVHELQVLDDEIPVAAHDVPLDLVVTPERAIRTETPYDRPTGIDWSVLSEDRIASIPILQELAPSDP